METYAEVTDHISRRESVLRQGEAIRSGGGGWRHQHLKARKLILDSYRLQAPARDALRRLMSASDTLMGVALVGDTRVPANRDRSEKLRRDSHAVLV
jgi:hypothetical protein